MRRLLLFSHLSESRKTHLINHSSSLQLVICPKTLAPPNAPIKRANENLKFCVGYAPNSKFQQYMAMCGGVLTRRIRQLRKMTEELFMLNVDGLQPNKAAHVIYNF
jgi:hypothetical protein